MNITHFAIQRDRLVLMLLFVITVLGIQAYIIMPRAEDPGFVIRMAHIVTTMPGAAPARVEELITDKLEKVIQEIPELDYVSSISKTGTSVIMVSVKPHYKEMRPIWDKLRRKISDVRSELPDGIIGPKIEDEFEDVFGIILAVTGEGYSYAELKEVVDDVRDELLLLQDVAKVEIIGAQSERIFAEYSNARLAELGLSPQQLLQVLSAQNIINPGGSILVGEERIVLEPTGNFESLEDLKRALITVPQSKALLYLEDIVKIYRGYVDPPDSKMTYSGTPALALAISLREGGNILELGETLKAKVERLQQDYPVGIGFHFAVFQPETVARQVNLFIRNLFEAILIVAAMVFLTLGVGTGLIVGTLVPTCILMTFLAMRYLDIGLDQVSLSALIIALGLLVDNGIVMVDSISVRMRKGEPVMQAAITSANELKIPLLIGTLITCAAFLPIYLAESETGEYTAPLFSVVSIALLSSWILALTLTPLLSVYFLKVKPHQKSRMYESTVYRYYRTVLMTALSSPWKTIGMMGVIFFLAMSAFRFVPILFFPPSDRTFFTAELELPAGTAIERTESVIKSIEQFVQNNLAVHLPTREEGVTHWLSFIGRSPPRFHLSHEPKAESPEYGFMILNATDSSAIDELVRRLNSYVEEHFPEIHARIARTELGPPVGHPIAVRVIGKDHEVLFSYVDEVKAKLASITGTQNVQDDWGNRTKKIVIAVNQARAKRSGVTNADIALSLQASLSGTPMTQFREEGDLIPILLRSSGSYRQDMNKLESLNVFSQATGQSVHLRQVADIKIVWEPGQILRRNLLRSVTVNADLAPGVTANEVNQQLFPWLKEKSKEWRLGYRYEKGGEFESADEANRAILFQIPLAGFIIILLLVAEFNSIRRTFIHLTTVMMGLIGVVVGLLITQSYFGFMALLGVVALAGVEVGHAIVLLDRIQVEMKEFGRTPQDAIIHAAQNRFRPIYLTAATAAGGLIPLWVSGGPMWEPMAIVLIFGLLFATLLTLGVLPVLYALFYRVDFRGYVYR